MDEWPPSVRVVFPDSSVKRIWHDACCYLDIPVFGYLMSKRNLVLALVVLVSSLSSAAFACSLAANAELMVDETLPTIVFQEFEANVAHIQRGGNTGSTCDGTGYVLLRIVDVDPEVGYTLEQTEGQAPKNLGQVLLPVIPNADGTLMMVWSDEISDEQPAVSFTVRITAVAPNGDTGPSRDVVISDPGVEGTGGCSATGHRDASLLGLMLFGLLFQWRRKD